jgi:hypothetical protein
MGSTIFLTFAGNTDGDAGKYSGIQDAAKRLQTQAVISGVFSSSIIVGWDEIYKFARSKGISVPLNPNKYGFTPLLAKMAISGWFGEAQNFFYAGAGCEILSNRFAKSDFKRMVRNVERLGIYVEGTRYKDISWCTNELIEKLRPSENHLNSGQVQATFFLLSKGSMFENRVNELIDEWVELAVMEDGRFLGDDFLPENQSHLFIAPRNDQSILSLLLKKYQFKIFREKRRGFGLFTRSLRGSNTFLFTSRNRTGTSSLPSNINNAYIGFVTMIIKPFLNFHDYFSDSYTVRKQYTGFPKESIARKSTWPW